jgi:hypothetical protein
MTFLRAAFAQNHASGRHALRAGRERRRQPRAARPVSPTVQDHGSLLVLKAKRKLLHARTVLKERTSVRIRRIDGPRAGRHRGGEGRGGPALDRRPCDSRSHLLAQCSGPCQEPQSGVY